MQSLNWRGYRVIAWIGQALLAIFVIAAGFQGKWLNALGLAFFLVASFVFVVRDDKLPTLFDFLFVLAALLNATGWVWNLFGKPGLYDEIVHAYTTFAITLALSFLVYSPMLNLFRNHTLLYLVTITSFGIAIGALWEIAEWSAGKVLSTEVIESLDDTIIDLVMDSLGAGLAALTSLWALRQWANSYLEAHD
ncbi:hypothetical protein ACN23B_26680 [Anabaena sp. FACHB-709]|uniref:DUF2238 domain-containing protein n=2 Tax=Nostocaceae TaxID=1162 RepID=A0A1Z4KPN2_ANAVA|nr:MULTISPECIES: hypothetical protein [Nostocaceae]BAY70919.1 hypothetical protein NIES23_37300 [Trichormus variabilis NIES-23]HBW31666.1 hypothetical protein [Nostoc sp. UBA8866]MBD2171321.1 hypothetical protein [Anabaena cylindrica FACHB-318]MBD2263009.1 hypothetical protein [Anabaena sp. FACHB-709]MBD2272648.1 hypothetical protein [Nostoc sp. PCC 7120 = FACHB-418]